jgi:cytochrome c-type biogenesis protein CcmH
MRDHAAALLLCAVLAPACAHAGDAALDHRVQRVTEELRCLVCQNQTIADSHAELAVMLKRQVREMLARGATEREAVDFMVQRYGDFVLYRPPVKATTWLLWFGPFGLLLAGLALLFLRLRARQLDYDPDAPDEEVPA